MPILFIYHVTHYLAGSYTLHIQSIHLSLVCISQFMVWTNKGLKIWLTQIMATGLRKWHNYPPGHFLSNFTRSLTLQFVWVRSFCSFFLSSLIKCFLSLNPSLLHNTCILILPLSLWSLCLFLIPKPWTFAYELYHS